MSPVVTASGLDHDFSCDRADQTGRVDRSDLWTSQRWQHLAIVVNLYSRRIVGWEAGSG